ncbi:MAG TPA: M1 family aminopeptidase [Gemmatimonadales bacterium]|nr:M1 family aminopeptidase [Gemmatimonadales bacterium]
MASFGISRLISVTSLLAASTAAAQQSDSARLGLAAAVAPGPEQYEPVFDQLSKMKPRGDSVAVVHNLSLRRDAIHFQLADGKLYLATPVAARTIAVIFVGQGSVGFAPPLAIERHEVRRSLGDSVLSSGITAAVLVFTDSTLSELARQVKFGPGGDVGRAADVLHDALDRLVDGRDVVQPTLISAVMNAETNGFFYAHVKREHGEDLMFALDPHDDEPVSLLRNGREGNKVQVVSEFRLAGDSSGSAAGPPLPESRSDLRPDAYRIEATIPKGLRFSANTTLRLTARRDGVRWVPLNLLSDLQVDTVSDETGAPLTFYRTKKSPALWVRFAAPARAGEPRWVHVAYHGDVIGYTSIVEQMTRWWPMWLTSELHTSLDRWYFVKSSYDWFPRYGSQAADVDLTFHTSPRYRLASIGRLVDSYTTGDMVTTHWTTERPADQVCFSVGELNEFTIKDPRIPPVTVHSNDDAHHQLDRFFLTLENKLGTASLFVASLLSRQSPELEVGGDIANSLAFFTGVYGKPLFERYYAAEIPFDYGQAFPGLIYLPVWTFQAMGDSGYDQILRAHEVAHQWWGIGVEPAGYRDYWLSEGFAEFSGWWYMQLVLHDNPKFFKHLEHWRKEIRARRNDASPIGIGTRAAYRNPRDAYLMSYYKGAWVLQMLRNMMLDLRTMKEDAFAAMMGDFYMQYRGKRATTRDFQRVVERHLGIPMDWFFEEWVNGTAIPKYILSWRADTTTDHAYTLRLRVRQEDVPADFVMVVPIRVELADGGHAMVRMNVRGPLTEAELRLPTEPTEVELNPLQSVLAEVKTEDWE